MIHKQSRNASSKSAHGSRSGPLGNNTKSSTPPESFDEEKFNRSERYRLLDTARNILFSAGKDAGLQYPANYHKTAKCIHTRLGENVQVYKSIEYKKSFYGGVLVCGKVFTCPVCSAKVQERRRIEIAQAFDWAYDNDKKVILVTITFPHQKTDDLTWLLKAQSKALAAFREGNVWQKKKVKIDFTGLIRSLEVTHSERNGFHPHTHEAWIVDPSVNAQAFRDWLAARWYRCCLKAGLITADYEKYDDFYNHSVQITDRASNSDYLAKMDSSKYWGADAELAKSSVKQAKGKGRHPFQLLDLASKGDTAAWAQFLEYTDGMRGKAQIFWSRGLKNLVGVDDLTDEELAQAKEDKADLLGHLSATDWSFIANNRLQSFILDLAETSGIRGVKSFIADNVGPQMEDTTEMPDSESKANAKKAYLKSNKGLDAHNQKRKEEQLDLFNSNQELSQLSAKLQAQNKPIFKIYNKELEDTIRQTRREIHEETLRHYHELRQLLG